MTDFSCSGKVGKVRPHGVYGHVLDHQCCIKGAIPTKGVQGADLSAKDFLAKIEENFKGSSKTYASTLIMKLVASSMMGRLASGSTFSTCVIWPTCLRRCRWRSQMACLSTSS